MTNTEIRKKILDFCYKDVLDFTSLYVEKNKGKNWLEVNMSSEFNDLVDKLYQAVIELLLQEIDKAREEGDIASDFLYWHPLGGGMPDSSIRIGVEFEVGGCYEDWGFVIEQNGRTISSGRTLKEAISKLKDNK